MLGWHHSGAYAQQISIVVGLACGKSALWADLVHSDGVVVAVNLHVVKMEAAIGLHVGRQRQWRGLVKLEGQGMGVGIMWWRGSVTLPQNVSLDVG